MYSLLAATDWATTFNSAFSTWEEVAKNGGKVIAVVVILAALVIGKTLVKVISAALLVGVALWAAYNVTSLQDKTTQEIEGTSMLSQTFTVPDPLPPLAILPDGRRV